MRRRLQDWRTRREIRRLRREADAVEAHAARVAGEIAAIRAGRAPRPVVEPASRWEVTRVAVLLLLVVVLVVDPPVVGPAIVAVLSYVAVLVLIGRALRYLFTPPRQDPPATP